MKRLAPVALFVCFTSLVTHAQLRKATTQTVWLVTVRGVIADPTSAVMPDATLVLQRRKHYGFRDVHSIKSDQTGQFDFGKNPPGIYRLIASAPGFCRISIPVEISRQGWDGIKIMVPVGATDTPPGYCFGEGKVEKLDE